MRALIIFALIIGNAKALFEGITAAPKRAGRAQFTGAVKPTGLPVRRASAPQPEDNSPAADAPVSLAITAIRIGTCALMVHHGIDKLQHVDGFSVNVVAKFFGFLPGEPQLWTYAAAATQIAGAGLLGVGLLSRPTALSMSGTMLAAVAFHLLNTGPEGFPLGVPAAHSYNFELAAMYVLVLLYFSAAGAGPYSVDEQLLGGELSFYRGLLDQVQRKE